ncbi:MAG: hypothetical protein IPK58_19300 [Acidobacteria bacterium]|nr:hypothetical protein [Acidobacteriota bacterium]
MESIKIIGADYVTVDGFTLLESGKINTTATQQMEWGIALLYATTTNGAQNVTLQNNTITLNRTNANTLEYIAIRPTQMQANNFRDCYDYRRRK